MSEDVYLFIMYHIMIFFFAMDIYRFFSTCKANHVIAALFVIQKWKTWNICFTHQLTQFSEIQLYFQVLRNRIQAV